MYAYEFKTSSIPGEAHTDAAYWRDVGTVDAYYEAQMDLCGVLPSLNLYNRRWPIRTASYPDPSAKFTFDKDGRPGQALGSIVSGGCILRGGLVRNSILGRGVNVAWVVPGGSRPHVRLRIQNQQHSWRSAHGRSTALSPGAPGPFYIPAPFMPWK